MSAWVPIIQEVQLPSGTAKIKLDKFNERIIILELHAAPAEVVEHIYAIADEYHVGKVIYVGLENEVAPLENLGFVTEAEVDGFLKGKTGFFLSKFILPQRKINPLANEAKGILEKALTYSKKQQRTTGRYPIRNANPGDIGAMAKVYQAVFRTYPTPMNNPDYIRKVMGDNLLFKLATQHDQIISMASADMDEMNLNAEITDCVTLPDYRGHGLMEQLVSQLESELRTRNYLVAYTIARALSPGINIVFAKLGYSYAGRLVNNCHICGSFEDMNIWAKPLLL